MELSTHHRHEYHRPTVAASATADPTLVSRNHSASSSPSSASTQVRTNRSGSGTPGTITCRPRPRFLPGRSSTTAASFARDPLAAALIDGEGNVEREIPVVDGAIPVDFSAGETFRVRAEW